MDAREAASRFADLMRTSWIMRILFVIFLASGITTVVYVDPFHPLPNYICTLLYILSAIAMIFMIYPDER